MRFVTAGCKPAEQERHPKSTKVCASLALQWGPDHTNPGLLQTQLFLTLCVKSISRYRPVHFLPAAFPEQRPYFGNPQERTTRKKKTQGFAHKSVFIREFTRSRSVTLQLLDDGWLT